MTQVKINSNQINTSNLVRGPEFPNNKNIVVRSGIFKQDSGDKTLWNPISDATTKPVGFDASFPAVIRENIIGGRSTFDMAIPLNTTYKTVYSVAAGTNAVLASQHVNVGVTASLDEMVLYPTATATLSGNLYFDGANWIFEPSAEQGEGILDNNVVFVTPTPSYNAVDGKVTINHDSVPGNNYSIIDRDRNAAVPYNVVVSHDSTDILTVIRFRNITNTSYVITNADTKMSVALSKTFTGNVRLDGVGFGSSFNLADGHIWVYGLFEQYDIPITPTPVMRTIAASHLQQTNPTTEGFVFTGTVTFSVSVNDGGNLVFHVGTSGFNNAIYTDSALATPITGFNWLVVFRAKVVFGSAEVKITEDALGSKVRSEITHTGVWITGNHNNDLAGRFGIDVSNTYNEYKIARLNDLFYFFVNDQYVNVAHKDDLTLSFGAADFTFGNIAPLGTGTDVYWSDVVLYNGAAIV
jgi:hypothetical protein